MTRGNRLTLENINQNILKAEYAVRGRVVQEAANLENELLHGQCSGADFSRIVYCNIGNPQQLAQKPITFLRHVQSLVTSADLLSQKNRVHLSNIFKKEEFERAEQILKSMDALPDENGFSASSTGAYTHSQGAAFIRDHVCQFIQKRDGIKNVQLDRDRIFLTDGASVGVKNVLNMLLRSGHKDAIMIPIPQYPLYSATITICNGEQVNYYLDEEKNWALNMAELERAFEENSKRVNIRALVVINPGNPTGACLTHENIVEVIQFCIKNELILLADEVYQDNIYDSSRPFHSFNKVMYELGLENDLQLFSFHSTSKGFLGECGRRGGYMHIGPAISNEVVQQFYKLASVSLCPNIHGQLALDILVCPPSGDCKHLYEEEKNAILASLKRRSKLLSETLGKLPGFSCQPIQGAMYAFPRINLPEKAVREAEKEGLKPDMFYVLRMLKETGVCCVPGSGFGQKDGTWHFRTTFLPQEDQMEEALERIEHFHLKFMERYS